MRAKKFVKTCIECGEKHHTARAETQFCSTACKAKFNNRRAARGAVLYDMWMANRHERGVAKALGLWQIATRLAMYWREEDVRDRDGRRSWQKPEVAAEASAWANSTIVNRNAAGVKRA